MLFETIFAVMLATKEPERIVISPGKSNYQIQLEIQLEEARLKQEAAEKARIREEQRKAEVDNLYIKGQVVKLYRDNTNNCYAWVVKQGYHPIGRGNARNIITNSNRPKVGGLVVTFESRAGHVAIVTAIGNNTFTLKESNYTKGWITSRILPINYGKLKGFVN